MTVNHFVGQATSRNWISPAGCALSSETVAVVSYGLVDVLACTTWSATRCCPTLQMIARSGRCCPEFGPAKIAAWFAEKKPKRKTFSLKVFFRQKNDTISDLTLTFPGHFYLFSAFSYSKYVMYWFALMSRGLLS